MTDAILTPFMLAAHRFAVVFQAVSLAMVMAMHSAYPSDDGLGFLIGWIIVFGAYSTFALQRHRRAIKAKAEQDKSA